MRATRLCLVAVIALLALPAAASAVVRCVPVAVSGCDTAHATFAGAVGAAGDGDVIRLAAGGYTAPLGGTIPDNVAIEGAGGGSVDEPPNLAQHSVITGALGASAAVRFAEGGALRDLRVQGNPAVDGQEAVQLDSPAGARVAYSIARVVALGGPGGTFGGLGLDLGPGSAPMDTTVSDSSFQGGPPDAPSILAEASAGSTTRFTDVFSRSTADESAVIARNSPLDVVSSHLVGSAGIYSSGPGLLTIDRSRIEGVDFGVAALPGGPAPVEIRLLNSLVIAEAEDPLFGVAVQAHVFSGAAPASLVVRGSTLVARGENPLAAAAAIEAAAATGEATIDLHNTVAQVGAGTDPNTADLLADDGEIRAAFSAFDTSTGPNAGVVPAPGSATNIVAAPLLAPDFSLLAGSPLIDSGDPAVVSAGELDLAGNPRSLDGTLDCLAVPDIGAFELTGHAAECPNDAPSLSAVSMTNKVFAPKRAGASAAQRRKRRFKRGTTFRYTLSEAARVTITIERQLKGRRVTGKCRKPNRRNRARRACKRFKRAGVLRADEQAGRQSTAFSGRFGRRALKPGRYRARLVATDEQGAKSAEKRLSFRIVRP